MIQALEIKNFKGIDDIRFDLFGKSVLIYGENGSGKSSSFEALRVIFYFERIKIEAKLKGTDINQFYKKIKTPDDIYIKASFENEKYIEIESGNIKQEYPEHPLTFFANRQILNSLVHDEFYRALKELFGLYMPHYQDEDNIFNNIEQIKKYPKKSREEIEDEIKKANDDFKKWFDGFELEKGVNEIISKYFKEKFKVSFSFEGARLDDSDIFDFIYPQIKIKIDDQEEYLIEYFNEAKLRLLGVAIFFTLVNKIKKHYDNKKSILVLDDFLTSLDTANRQYIVSCMIDYFCKDQIIVFTHNIHFFDLFKKQLNLVNKSSDWLYKCVFLSILEQLDKISVVDCNEDYLKDIEKYMGSDNGKVANLLRKQLEKLVFKIYERIETGKRESLGNIFRYFTSNDISLNSSKNDGNTSTLLKKFICILNDTNISDNEKIKKFKDLIKSYNENIEQPIKHLQLLNQIMLNPGSHDNVEIPNSQKVLRDAFETLKKLKEAMYKI